jgi:hypothetical protein
MQGRDLTYVPPGNITGSSRWSPRSYRYPRHARRQFQPHRKYAFELLEIVAVTLVLSAADDDVAWSYRPPHPARRDRSNG